jgi:hypothetical protein
MSGWVGVDLDGRLARYDGWQGASHIGEPIASNVGASALVTSGGGPNSQDIHRPRIRARAGQVKSHQGHPRMARKP